MATTGMDGYVKCWDVRTSRMLHAYTTLRPADGLDISQSGLLAVGQGSHVQVWKDALQAKQRSPYLSHEMPARQVSECRFCPYEDALGVGHSGGFASLGVPGSGFANFDSFEANPFQTKQQRQEAEVKTLLEKLRPEMITLDANFIGNVADHDGKLAKGRAAQADRRRLQGAEEEDDEEGGDKQEEKKPAKEKRKKRGRSTAMKRFLKKQTNVIDESKARRREALEEKDKAAKHEAKLAERRAQRGLAPDAEAVSALDRFG